MANEITMLKWKRTAPGHYTSILNGEDVEIIEVFDGGHGWRLQAVDGSWVNDRAETLKEAKLDAEFVAGSIDCPDYD